ncbi:MAG: T9SS type A sorting domain-containing protein, partial [Croceitalea sp.]|nr:T9SS type A sorting domain-containing protein [Croceitalea sp.]
PGTGYTQSITAIGDCDDTDANVYEETTWYLDADGDGYAISSMESCISPGSGYTQSITAIGDCDDSDSSVIEETTWYLDADGDGYAFSSMESCTSPGSGYSSLQIPISDCDDNDAEINPETVWYLDANNDGILDDANPIISCTQPGPDYKTVLLETQSAPKVKLYPNPFTNLFAIDLGEEKEGIEIIIVDASQKLVFSESYGKRRSVEFNLSRFPTGIYFVHVISKGKSMATRKVIRR